MRKAVVFDDEFIVLQGFQTKVDWSHYGIDLAGTAANGIEALAVFRSVRPDIIFTDIRMPGMDGLQLLEIITQEAPDTICIVFSGFNEFEYVKRALKIGVIDFIEKPITLRKIQEALQKVNIQMNKQKELLEKATLDLLLMGAEAEVKWLSTLGVNATGIAGVTVLACSSEKGYLTENDDYRVIKVRNGSEYIALVIHVNPATEPLKESMNNWAEHAGGVSVGSGRTYVKLADATKSYREAQSALRYGMYLEGEGWTRYEDLAECGDLPDGLTAWEELFVFYIRTCDTKGVFQQLERFKQSFEAKNLEKRLLELEILKLVYLGWEAAKEAGVDMAKIMDADQFPHVQLRKLVTLDEIIGWFRDHIDRIMKSMIDTRQRIKHDSVDKAVSYMALNYNRDISLKEVASHVGMNATYFSLLFKESKGLSYIKYLTRMRMEQAKTLLLDGLLINEVSEKVGYYHYRHFTEVFKKYTGVTPGQYRETHRKSE
ncbi:response regulator [Paenibacillus sp. LjRoot153]|uniref:response regulator n=1 Tax=Paenibacillus sp. LjRoot153 TaxID=3342270 RepID=UPI003ECCF257